MVKQVFFHVVLVSRVNFFFLIFSEMSSLEHVECNLTFSKFNLYTG